MPTARFHQVEGIRLLLVEDDTEDAELASENLSAGGRPRFEIVHVRTLADARCALESREFDVVMADLGLPDSHGLATLEQIREATAAAVIVYTGLEYEEMALAALNRGADDYLAKGTMGRRPLVRAIRYAMERRRAINELDEARRRRARTRATQRLRTIRTRLGPVGWPAHLASSGVQRRDEWSQLVAEYAAVVAHAVSGSRTPEEDGSALHALATRLTAEGAGPADLVALHDDGMKQALAEANAVTAQVMLARGRVALVELMGALVDLLRPVEGPP